MVKDVVKIIMKVNIYPSKEEFRDATEAYLAENHSEFYNNFTEVRWTSFYNSNFLPPVSPYSFENLFLN